ncbi:MAG: type IX secretion system protein PorQ [Flavobacteriaceae bacterium]
MKFQDVFRSIFSYFVPMIRKYSCLLLLFLAFFTQAQVGGKHTYEFLNLVSSPRQAALGGKVLTNNDWDSYQALHNPSAITEEMDGQLALNFVNYFADVNFGSLSYAKSFGEKKHIIAAGITYVDYGNFEGYDNYGISTGEFSGNEFALTVGYKYNVPNSNLKIGANGKFISSKLETYSSVGAALDIAALYEFKASKSIVTLVASNIGGQLSAYQDTKESIPFHVDLAFAKKLENLPLKWHIVYENLQEWDLSFQNPNRGEEDLDGTTTEENISVFNKFMQHIVIGGELFHGKALNIRLGYNFRRGHELKIEDSRVFAGITAGFGLKLNKFRVNYAFQKYSAAANVHSFGLNINLR